MKHIYLSLLVVMISCGMSNAQSSNGRQPANRMLGFQLFDAYGRQVESADYAGAPVLIFIGSCWCGGCMEDTQPIRQLAEAYAGRGLVCIRTVAGDNELAALDYQNHFGLPMVQLLDPNREFEKRYNPDGWTFLMLCDREGRVVYTVHHFPDRGDEDWNKLMAALERVLSKAAAPQTVKRDGTVYMAATLQRSGELQSERRNERFASMTCGPDGEMYLVFTAVRHDSCDVLLRRCDGTNWSPEIPIAATAAQEYDATVLADGRNRVWVCWTASTGEGRHEVCLTSLADPSRLEPAPGAAHSEEEAMHGRMACDKSGGIWLTYYKWYNLRHHGSRGKRVCLRRFEQDAWSKEVEISPTDVPQFEKHFDPAIWPCQNGMMVAWIWDFHPQNCKGYSSFAGEPTVFIRQVEQNMGLGRITSVSGKNIDLTPALGVTGKDQVWCAWDSQSRDLAKQVCLAHPAIGVDLPPNQIQALERNMRNVCTPVFIPKPDGGLALIWSETADGKQWVLRGIGFDAVKNQWSQPQTVASRGNPRFASGAYDKQGHLWVAYSAETQRGREMVARRADNL